jgi:hypothetical protein
MGNQGGKLSDKSNLLSKAEMPALSSLFKAVGKSSDHLREDELMVSVRLVSLNLLLTRLYHF